jgi:XTP/dITP diphosphohydrolase
MITGDKMILVIATRNAHKLEEIQTLFDHPNLHLHSAFDFPDVPDVIEDGQTLEANAIKKAVTLALATGHWSLADDTGLEVAALNGAPGVYSARYAGAGGDYDANNRKLLAELAPHPDRSAQFRCVIALSDPTGRAQFVEGICRGRIANIPRGEHGFGYDPLFVPEEAATTFAEMTADAKNAISHRGRALQQAARQWQHLLTNTTPK